MKTFLFNLLLALAWTAITGYFYPGNFIFGFILAFMILRSVQERGASSRYFQKVASVTRFIGFFAKELIKANLRVAYDVMTPKHHMRPGVVAIPLDVRTDAEITLLANLITLTPGTLSLDVSSDRKTLYIHAMYIKDTEETRRSVKEGFERRVMEIFR